MKKIKIFVEGVADATFFLQYINEVFGGGIVSKEDFIIVGGWNNISSNIIINQLRKNTAEGGLSIVLFDADANATERHNELEAVKTKYNIDFTVFLIPNDNDAGALEDLLERIINPENQCVIDCWHRYEADLARQIIPWKNPPVPTIPAKKTMIYGYLEALLGTSHSQKEKIKERNRDYGDENLWHMDADALEPLKAFLLPLLKS